MSSRFGMLVALTACDGRLIPDREKAYEPRCPAHLRKESIPIAKEVPTMRLTGSTALVYAAQEGLLLNCTADEKGEPRREITLAEAMSIAERDPEAIWLEIPRGEPAESAGRRG
jgi:hypothetical protein